MASSEAQPKGLLWRVAEVLLVATRLGLTSFGGPIAHLGYFRSEYVTRRRWLDEHTYADLVALSQLLPGPASSQVGIAVGITRAGLLGGVAAWLGFTLPSAIALVLFAYGVGGIDNVSGVGWLNGKGWVLASETCALDHLGAEFIREVVPGEAVRLSSIGVETVYQGGEEERRALCLFEYIYLARPDSIIGNRLVYSTRHAMGRELAREHPVDADIVIGIPDSALAAAAGYAEASGLPYRDGLLKNRYVGRTFIEPDQRIRDLGVRLKFNPLPAVLRGQRVVVVDDSIVRGTTTPHVVSLLRKAGAREVHLRVCAPPIRHPCFFGVDMAARRELIAANRTVPEIQEATGVDTLGYLSVEGLLRAVGPGEMGFCAACFTGTYPIPVQLEMDKLALEA